ncbi:taste receptor type 2 member 40-like [Pithys albifrons albifrons]|uniref:taste receptor type 2 member 40-like n=1 Tax=Pithys albifrons albifrons TaxID=3385563 RepID=UPI003A5CEEA4
MEGCHSADISNVTSYNAMVVAIVTFEAFGGMWINALIVSVICMVWIKNKTLNSIEKILLFLGCSRFWYLCIAWINSFLSVIYPNYLYVYPIFPLVQSTQSFFNCSNLWVTACLCGFYCIKIAIFRNSFFIYLKEKTDRIVPWLLLGSELFSLVIGILVYDIVDKGLRNKATLTCHGIIWKANIRREEYFFPIYFITGFLFATSFTAVILSALLLLFSLWRHKCNMQTNSMKDVSMDAHIKAMKSILSFLIMYSINFISLILTLVYSMKNENDVLFLSYLIQYAFPSVHSLILIFSNPKLKKILLRILPCVNCKDCIK